MPDKEVEKCRIWYDQSYSQHGFSAQRRYPNEELCRFLGREYGKVGRKGRGSIAVLEIGCGSCANLWMVAKEGFDAYGLDISEKSLVLGRQMLANWKVGGKLTSGSMTSMPYKNGKFDVVIDVLASYCLTERDFRACLAEVRRVLRRGGKFFSYTLSSKSDAFRKHAPSKMLDAYTLDGIKRKTSPYHGNDFPIRFATPQHYKKLLEDAGFAVEYLETTGRTYRGMKEYFEYITAVGVKK